MKILLVAATLSELKPIQEKLDEELDEHEIFSLITGVGMIATTFELTRTLMVERFDLAINAGIAGAFDKTIELGEVVEVIQDQFSEELIEDGVALRSYHEIGLRDENEPPFYYGVLKRSFTFVQRSLDEAALPFKEVRAITVNKVHGNDFSIHRIKERLNPQVESMEGAAFFYVCSQMDIPTLQIRAISNYVEKRNPEAWKIELALNNLAEAISTIINKL